MRTRETLLVTAVTAFGVVLIGCPSEDDGAVVEDLENPDFAYQASVDDGQRIHAATLDGKYVELTDGEGFSNEDMEPVFSWDGNKIAYSHGDSGRADIFVHDLDEGTQTRLTEFGEQEAHFCTARNFNSGNDAISMRCSTGDDVPSYAATVSTDGEATIFEPDDGLLDVDDDQLHVLDGGFYEDDDFLGLTWYYDSVADETIQEIRRLDPDNPTDSGEVLAELEEAGIPATPVARQADEANVMVVSLITDPDDPEETVMYEVNLDTGESEELLGDESNFKYPLSMDASGQRLLYALGTSGTGIGRLALMDLDDRSETVLADENDLQRGSLVGTLSADGQQVIFADTEADPGTNTWQQGSLYRVDADGSNLELIDWVHDIDEVTTPRGNLASF